MQLPRSKGVVTSTPVQAIYVLSSIFKNTLLNSCFLIPHRVQFLYEALSPIVGAMHSEEYRYSDTLQCYGIRKGKLMFLCQNEYENVVKF